MGAIKFPHTSGNSMSIAAPATNPASDLELKLPATVGTANQVLKNSGTAGTLEFGDAGLPAGLAYASSTLTVTGHIKADGGFGVMEPGFVAAMVGDEQIDHSTNHKFVNWTNYTAAYNPGWDGTNDKFTVPTGGAGKYLFGWKLAIGDNHQQHLDEDEVCKVWLNINGGGIGRSETRTFGNSGNAIWQVGTVVWDLADADYIEMYAWHDEGARVDINDDYSLFWGFRMAEGD
jgi:hypothetical protein